MSEQTRADSLANPILIRRKLPQQQAGNRVGRLASPDLARKYRGHDRRRCEAIITNDPIGFMDDKNGRKALLLIGECSRLEPAIERRLAAGELGRIMRGRQGLWLGDRQTSTPGL